MTYKEAVKQRDKYKYLIGKPLSPEYPNEKNLITHLVIANADTLSKILADVLGNRLSNENALLLNGIGDNLEVFLVCFSNPLSKFISLTIYLSKFPSSPNQ